MLGGTAAASTSPSAVVAFPAPFSDTNLRRVKYHRGTDRYVRFIQGVHGRGRLGRTGCVGTHPHPGLVDWGVERSLVQIQSPR